MFDPIDLARASDRTLTIIRFFNAPRERLFRAWTDPERMRKWWGPKHHPATQIEADVRVGGRIRCGLRSEDTGNMLYHYGVYREVTPPERIAFTFAWEEEGERGLETLVTITFAEHGGRTRMVLQQTPFQSVGERDSHQEGWSSMLERLGDYLMDADA